MSRQPRSRGAQDSLSRCRSTSIRGILDGDGTKDRSAAIIFSCSSIKWSVELESSGKEAKVWLSPLLTSGLQL